MQFSPTKNELTDTASMTKPELLQYFVSRTAEVEEVWGLSDNSGWVLREDDGVVSLPVWPYKKYSLACAMGNWANQIPDAVSLEHFIFKILKRLMNEEIMVEIMPNEHRSGQLIDPSELFVLFESVIESGEYYLEG